MRVATLSWDGVASRIAGGAIGVLPVGAGAKQHGFHLPMDTDRRQADRLADYLATTRNALVWPTLTYGAYPAFTAYAGSTTVSTGLFENLVAEIVASISGSGLRGLIILDTGISTIGPIDRAIAAGAETCLHLKIYDGPRFRDAARLLCGQDQTGHADDVETSILLSIAPDVVMMDRAARHVAPMGPGPLQHDDPAAANYSASGVIGDPTGATRAKGDALLAAMIADMDTQIDAWLPTIA